MVAIDELEVRVDAVFEHTGAPHRPWPDPNPGGSPADEAYSRVTDPERYLIIGARVDAWVAALVELGLGVVERDVDQSWSEDVGPRIVSVDRVRPHVVGALSLVLARTTFAGVDGAGLVIGAGDPAVVAGWHPDCGCDACDSGSDDLLELLDSHIRSIVAGDFRRLRRGNKEITVIDPPGWTARGLTGRGRVRAVLDDPHGWREVNGAPWL